MSNEDLLATLYVASSMLHSSFERGEILAAIEQIVINLVGSEELAIFEVSGEADELQLASSFGIDAARYARVPLAEGIIGHAASTQSIWLAADDPSTPRGEREASLMACIPLAMTGRLVGAIAVFRLLQQKPRLTDGDRELFELLKTHAASALRCSAILGAVS